MWMLLLYPHVNQTSDDDNDPAFANSVAPDQLASEEAN